MDARVINFPAIQHDDSSPQFLTSVSEMYQRVLSGGPVRSLRTLFYRCLYSLRYDGIHSVQINMYPDAQYDSWWLLDPLGNYHLMLSNGPELCYKEGLVLLGDILWHHINKLVTIVNVLHPCNTPYESCSLGYIFAQIMMRTLAVQTA